MRVPFSVPPGRRLGIELVALAVIVVLAVAAAPAFASGTTPFQQVLVINPASSPVPVSLQGTGAISGTVSAVQSGNWSVTDPDAPGKNPVVISCDIDIPKASLSGSASSGYTVPAGKRLVIEVIHLESATVFADNVVIGDITTRINGHSTIVTVPAHLFWTDGAVENFFDGLDNLTRTYADAGSTPTCQAQKQSTASTQDAFVGITAIGYLINVP